MAISLSLSTKCDSPWRLNVFLNVPHGADNLFVRTPAVATARCEKVLRGDTQRT